MTADYGFARSKAELDGLFHQDSKAEELVDQAKEELAYWKKNWKDDPNCLSGWAHNFFCPNCASEMVFAPDSHQYGQEYVCSHCGHRVEGVDFDEAWTYLLRYRSGQDLEDIALLARLGNAEAGDFIRQYVDTYAQWYKDFPVHGRWAGKGKLMGQGLDEAVWAIKVLRAVKAAQIDLTKPFAEEWYQKLFGPLADFLDPQVDRVHNIPLWLKCAEGIIALMFDKEELLQRALEGPFGIRKQVEQGFTADGLWYEGSMSYHYYAAEALTCFCQFYREICREDPLYQRLEAIYLAPFRLSWNRWDISSVNDGWHGQDLSTYGGQIAYACRVAPSLGLQAQLFQIQKRRPEIFSKPRFLLYLEEAADTVPFPEGTAIMNHSCFALLQGAFPVLFKTGVLTASHAHPDSMSIEIAPFSRDLGTPGYGNSYTPKWYRTTPCHNTVTVCGENQTGLVKGEIQEISGGVEAFASGVYEGVDYRRRLCFAGETLQDTFTVTADREVTADWIFSSRGEAVLPESQLEPCPEPLYASSGYPMFRQLQKYTGKEPFRAAFLLDGKRLELELSTEEGTVYVAKSPDNPADLLRTSVIWRKKGENTVFTAFYEKKN